MSDTLSRFLHAEYGAIRFRPVTSGAGAPPASGDTFGRALDDEDEALRIEFTRAIAAGSIGAHVHSAADITSGNLDYARMPIGNGTWDTGAGTTITIARALTVTGALAGTLATASQPNVTTMAALATVGTITSGTWQATPIVTTYGGTGLASWTAGDVPYYASGNTLSKLAISTANYVLTSSGSAPQWSSSLTGINTTGSAATLTTTRTIWGQNFNGSANVDGTFTQTSGNAVFAGTLTVVDTITTNSAGGANAAIQVNRNNATALQQKNSGGSYVELIRLRSDNKLSIDDAGSVGVWLSARQFAVSAAGAVLVDGGTFTVNSGATSLQVASATTFSFSTAIRNSDGTSEIIFQNSSGVGEGFAFRPVSSGNAVIQLRSLGGAVSQYIEFLTGTTVEADIVSVSGQLLNRGASWDVRRYADGTQQFGVVMTAGATRYATFTGSNGGNPTLNVTGGSLAVTPATIFASSVTMGALAATTGSFTNIVDISRAASANLLTFTETGFGVRWVHWINVTAWDLYDQVNGNTALRVSAAASGSHAYTFSGAATGITTLDTTGKIQATLTTEQMRLRYDAGNYMSVTVDSAGSTTFALTGTSPTFTFSQGVAIGGTLALGANNLTMTGSIASTGSRVTKGWFTDLEVTNAIAGSVTGSAATLSPGRNINGVLFDGSAAITVTAAAGTLTGTTLNSSVVTSSLTTVGTIGTGVWQGTVIVTTYGGTGLSSWTAGDLPYYASGTALSKLAIGSADRVLTSSGSAPQWSASLTGINTTGSAATLTTTRTIWGQNFNGSANVTGALTGVTDLTMDGILFVAGTAPRIRMNDTNGTADKRIIDLAYNTASLDFEARNDAGSFVRNVLTLAHDGDVGIAGTLTQTAGKILARGSSSTSQSDPAVSGRGVATAFEWGHGNSAGYGSNLGYENSAGLPWVGFHVEHGTNNNTYKTRGVVGSVMRSDGVGGFTFAKVATASADNQSLTGLATLSNAGLFTVTALTLSTGDLKIASGSRYYVDGGSDTYVHESSANVVQVVAGGSNAGTFTSSAAAFPGDVSMAATKRFYVDGGSNTYIHEQSADRVDVVTGGTTAMALTSSFLIVPATSKIYPDGGGDSYFHEVSANVVRVVAGGSVTMSWSNGDSWIEATKKFYIDGGGDTYFHEDSANRFLFVAGGGNAAVLTSTDTAFATTTTANAANLYQGGSMLAVLRSTSSRLNKQDIRPMTYDHAARMIFGAKPVFFRSAIPTDDQNVQHVGFIAEDVKQISGCYSSGEGRNTSLFYDRFVAPLTLIAQNHEDRIAETERRIRDLERELAVLKAAA